MISVTLIVRYFLIVLSCFIYFYLYRMNCEYYIAKNVTFINVPDNLRYLNFLQNGFSEFSISGVNNYGIVFIYSLFSDFIEEIDYFSFFVNFLVLSYSYFRLESLSKLLSGSYLRWKYIFMYFSLLPFVLMINKDAFSVLFFLLIVGWWFSKRYSDFILILLVSLLKIQFLPIFIVFLFLNVSAKIGKIAFIVNISFVYLIFCVFSYYFSSLVFNLGHHDISGGVIYLKYYANNLVPFSGDFFLNVISPVQFFYDIFRSVKFENDILLILISFFKIILLFILFIKINVLIKIIYFPLLIRNKDQLFVLACLVISFFLVMIVSPIINYRYCLSLVPVLMLIFSVSDSGNEWEGEAL